MATYNADQLNPPDDGATPSVAPAPTAEERAALTAEVKGTALSGQVPPVEPEVVEAPAPPAEVVVPEDTGTVVALADRFDVTTAGETWPHDMLEFKGDLLGIRLPTRQALAAFSLASSKYVSLGVKNDLTGLFIARHLSHESYGRVFSRLMDPDEVGYDVDTVGELFNAIVTAAVEADKAAAKDDDAK